MEKIDTGRIIGTRSIVNLDSLERMVNELGDLEEEFNLSELKYLESFIKGMVYFDNEGYFDYGKREHNDDVTLSLNSEEALYLIARYAKLDFLGETGEFLKNLQSDYSIIKIKKAYIRQHGSRGQRGFDYGIRSLQNGGKVFFLIEFNDFEFFLIKGKAATIKFLESNSFDSQGEDYVIGKGNKTLYVYEIYFDQMKKALHDIDDLNYIYF